MPLFMISTILLSTAPGAHNQSQPRAESFCRRYGTQPGSSDACRIQLATSSSSSWSSSWMSR